MVFSLLVFEVSWSHATTHHSRQDSSGRVINPSQRPLPDNTQHSQQTNIRVPGGIRTHNLSRRAAEDLRLRPRGHWDRLALQLYNWNSKSSFLTSYNRQGIHSQERSWWCELCNYWAEHILFILLFLKRTHVVVFHKLNNRNNFGKPTGPSHSLGRASWYTHVRKTNKMHIFCLNNLFHFDFTRHVSN